jgi:hypothetical protein
LNFIQPRDFDKRKDTYPFLSSDGYSFRCAIQIPKSVEEDELSKIVAASSDSENLYIPGRFVLNVLSELKVQHRHFRAIVIGDDDNSHDENVLRELSEYAQQIYSVNLLSNFHNIVGIPLGLESPSYRSGGRLSNFRKIPMLNPIERPINFLVSWNVKTNLERRSDALEHFKRATDVLLFENRIAPQTLHALTRRTLFVPSPRGNGIDTHRVWESLYLGAIPVVLSADKLPAFSGWPIWIIEDWSEATSLSRSELELKYVELACPYSLLIEKSKSIYGEISKWNLRH